MWQSVSQDMYKNSSQEPSNNQKKKSEASSEDVTDVDFEEVNDDKKTKK